MMQKKSYFLEEISSGENIRARILCLHGLNQNPQALKTFLKDLSQYGAQVFLIHLPGHYLKNQKDEVSSELVEQAYQESYEMIQDHYGPIDYFMGYSYGGLLGSLMSGKLSYKKMFLLAPALKIRSYTQALRVLLPFLSKIQSIPLGNPELEALYRFHEKGVPRSIYKSFFQHYQKFQRTELRVEIPTLIYCHPKDELIDYSALKKWASTKSMCQFQTLSNTDAEFRRYNHLCFDPMTLGKKQYEKLLHETCRFFELA